MARRGKLRNILSHDAGGHQLRRETGLREMDWRFAVNFADRHNHDGFASRGYGCMENRQHNPVRDDGTRHSRGSRAGHRANRICNHETTTRQAGAGTCSPQTTRASRDAARETENAANKEEGQAAAEDREARSFLSSVDESLSPTATILESSGRDLRMLTSSRSSL